MGKIIGLVIVAVLLVGGFLYWNSRGGDSAAMKEETGGTMSLSSDSLGTAKEESKVVSSIKDAMGLGRKMQCTYAIGDDKAIQATVLVDGEKFKSTTVMKDMTVHGLFDGETQYTWTDKEKQGSKMSKACLDKMTARFQDMSADASKKESAAAPSVQDLREGFDGLKDVQCQAASAVDFSLPKDVSFVDQCAMIEQSMKMMDEMKDKLPAGMTMPAMPAAY